MFTQYKNQLITDLQPKSEKFSSPKKSNLQPHFENFYRWKKTPQKSKILTHTKRLQQTATTKNHISHTTPTSFLLYSHFASKKLHN
jgi:hypothetical protein